MNVLMVTIIAVFLPDVSPLVHVGTLSDGLRSPARVAVAAEGRVYVTDPWSAKVVWYDASGAWEGSWPIVEGPLGIAAHPDGRVFISLRDTHEIGIYVVNNGVLVRTGTLDGDGNPVVSLDGPTDIAIDPATGRIYVVDAASDDVYGFESDGSLALKFGIRGEGNGQFMYPSAIAFDGGADHIIVADHDNFRGEVFDTSGVFQRRFGFRMIYLPGGVQEGWMPRTQGLAVDSLGHIYVADALMSAVRILDSEGHHLGKVVSYGSDPGDLRTPCDLALSPDGTRLYVVSTNTSSVEVYQTPTWLLSPGGGAGDGGFDPPGTDWCALDAKGPLAPLGLSPLGGPTAPGPQPGYDGPHMNEDASIICGRCHGLTGQPGGDVGTQEGQQALCFSCHSAGGQALDMPLHERDAADPYGTNPNAVDGQGSSHAWGVPAVSAAADSVGPAPGGEMERYLDDSGNIKCATCHNQHNSDAGAPYLRVSNAGDAMCKECHAPRNEGPGARGTHAVGFAYPAGQGEFPDAAAIDPLALISGNVECQTCHAVHNATSGGVNGGEGDGMLLRTANGDALCQTCHTEHGRHEVRGPWQPGCQDCHDVHDPASENLALVSRLIFGTAVTFEDDDVSGDGLADFIHGNHDPARYDGVCEVCHENTAHHRNSADGDHDHYAGQNCTDCHPHSAGFLPTGGSCTDCHGQPPDGDAFPNTAGAHAVHMSDPGGPGISNCFVCHAALSAGNHNNGQSSFASGVDSNGDGDIDLSETDVCDSCHSPDGPFDGVAEGKSQWSTGAGVSCEGCHDTGTSVILGVSAPPVAGDNATWGYYATGHGRSQAVACLDCHDDSAPHFDGVAHTYSAALDNYQTAFRLSDVNGGPPLVVPRFLPDVLDAYDDPPYWELCFQCHDKYALIGGPDAPAGPYYADEFRTNFRSQSSVIIPDGEGTDIAEYSIGGAADVNSHHQHLAGPPHFVDSDHDGETDSFGTCVACHNVHGSTFPAMIRDGKLIGAEPSLNFGYVRYDRTDPPQGGCESPIIMTSDGVTLAESQGGIMRANSGENGVCTFCHVGGAGTGDPEYIINCYTPDPVAYYRDPVATASGCGICHARPLDNGDGLPVGGRRAVMGEFPAGDAHAHFGAELNSAACVVCHDMTTHMDGYVDLLDADTGALYRFVEPADLVSDPDLSDFCMSCHDADGAARLADPADPFGNGNAPPDVATKFMGTLQWNEWYGDACFGEEGTLRGVNSHHDISDADQAFSGAKIECLNCHGSHSAGSTQPLIDPYDPASTWSGDDNAFCLACHTGGNGPTDPAFPDGVVGPSVALRGLDTCDYQGEPWYVDYRWTHTAHGPDSKRGWDGYSGAPSFIVDCMVCHDPHGSYTPNHPAGNPYMIRDFVDGTSFVDDGYRYGGNWNGPPWDTYGTARDVQISISGLDVDWGGPTGLCAVCHANWLPAQHYHDTCTACQTCHGHGQAFGEYDWVSPYDDQPCPAKAGDRGGDGEPPIHRLRSEAPEPAPQPQPAGARPLR